MRGRIGFANLKNSDVARRVLVAAIAVLALINSVSSIFNNNGQYYPSLAYTICKIILFASLVVAIWLLGHAACGPGVKAAKPDPLLTLRALACALVLIGHYFIIEFRPATLIQGFHERPWSRLLVGAPWPGVWMFFVLSGYLMGKGFYTGRYDLTPGGLSSYFRNRFLRILPVYLVVVLACSAFFSPQIFQRENLWILSEYMTFDFKGLAPVVPVGAAWTVSTEVQFYFLAPFMSNILCRIGSRQTVLFLIISPFVVPVCLMVMTWGSLAKISALWYPFVYSTALGNIALFAGGICLNNLVAWKRLNGPLRRQDATVGGLIILGAFGVLITLAMSSGSMLQWFAVMGPLPTLWATATAIYLFEASAGELSARLAGWVKRTEIFGALTYCIYLIHEPVMGLFRPLLPVKLSLHLSLAMFPVVMVAIFASAYVLYRLVEKPFDQLRISHHEGREKKSAPAAIDHS